MKCNIKQQNDQILTFLYSIKTSDKTLRAGDDGVNKKEFLASEERLALDLVHVNKVLVSDKFKHSDKGFKYFIGYKDDASLRLLCFFLFQMCGYIKYFDNRGNIFLLRLNMIAYW